MTEQTQTPQKKPREVAIDELMGLFYRLAGESESDQQDGEAAAPDRGALAALRQGLSSRPGSQAALYPYVIPAIQSLQDRKLEYARIRTVFFLVAALFGLHPRIARGAEGRRNMGDLCRDLGRHESAEKRFIHLLNARSEDLPVLLRQVVAMAASHKDRPPIDYRRLIYDLLQWNDPSRKVQLEWAGRFWRYEAEPTPNSDAAAVTAPSTE